MCSCGSEGVDLEFGEHLDREASMELVESNGDVQSTSRMTNQDHLSDRVGKARVPNLRA